MKKLIVTKYDIGCYLAHKKDTGQCLAAGKSAELISISYNGSRGLNDPHGVNDSNGIFIEWKSDDGVEHVSGWSNMASFDNCIKIKTLMSQEELEELETLF